MAYGADIEKGSPVASGVMGLGPRGLRFEGYSGVRGRNDPRSVV